MSLASLLDDAQSAHDRRDWRNAARAYAAFIAAGGDAVPTLLALGDVLREAGEVDEALQNYGRMMELAPRDPAPAFRLGELAAALDRPALAREALRRGHRAGAPDAPATPLRDVLAVEARGLLVDDDLLRASGPDPFSTAGRVEPAAGPLVDLHLLSSGPTPQAKPTGTVAVLHVEAGDGMARRDAGRVLAAAMEGGAALAVAFLSGADQAAATHAQALALQFRALRLPHLLFGSRSASGRALVNVGLAIAQRGGAHALVCRPGAAGPPPTTVEFGEDPMAGFAVSGADEPSATAVWRRGPASPGGWVLIRNRIIAEFGGLDALYDGVDAALIDLMARADRHGFGCLLRDGPQGWNPPALSEEDGAILSNLYPEQARFRTRALTDPRRLADRISAPRVLERRSLLLDLTGLREHHDGTAEFATRVARALAVSGGRDVHLWCSEAAARFHCLDRLQGATLQVFDEAVPAPPTGHPVCLKLGQPLTWAELLRTWTAAPLSGFLMLDSIAGDVAMLDGADYGRLWSAALAQSDIIGWLGGYARAQFGRRFGVRSMPGDFTAFCSTAPDDYAHPPRDGVRTAGRGALLVGNPFPHKNVLATVDRLRRAWPDLPLTVLGASARLREGVTWLRSGGLSREVVDALYADCEVVVFPSFYESFGLPVMNALARGRPVLALDQPSLRELAARCPLGRNLHLFGVTDELVAAVDRVRTRPFEAADPFVQPYRWSDAARAVAQAADRAVARFDPVALERRLATGRRLAEAAGA